MMLQFGLNVFFLFPVVSMTNLLKGFSCMSLFLSVPNQFDSSFICDEVSFPQISLIVCWCFPVFVSTGPPAAD